LSATIEPSNVAVAPSATKITEKPATNETAATHAGIVFVASPSRAENPDM
jgi:hypothetical protein